MKKILLLLTFLAGIYSVGYSQCGSTLIPSVSITGSPNAICQGQAVTFTAVAVNGGPAPVYEWRINGMAVTPPSSLAYFTTSSLSTTDMVTVVLTSNDPCASPATAVSAFIQTPVSYGITSGSIGLDQTICYNTVPASIAQLTAPIGTTGAVSYTWEASLDGVTGWITIPGTGSGYDFTTPLTQDVYIRRVVTDPGLPSPCNVAYSSVIHIIVRPDLTGPIIGSDQTICSGSATATMTQNTPPTGGAGTYTYQWESSTTGTAFTDIVNATNATYNGGPLSVTTYYRCKTMSVSCGMAVSNVVTKTVDPAEAVTASINDPGQVCEGSPTITFTAAATTTGTGTLSYAWDFNGSPVGTNSATYTYNPVIGDDNKVVRVVVTTSTGCNTGPATSNIVTLDIVGATTPTVTISGPSVQCDGLPVTFTATSTGAGPVPVYQWYVVTAGSPVPGIPLATSGVTYSTTTLSNGDRVYVELTSSLACLTAGLANPIKSNELTILIKPLTLPAINENNQTICAPNTFTYTANVNVGSVYQWFLNNNPIAGATNETYTANQSGTYSIREDNGTCSATSAPVQLTLDPCGAFSTTISGPNPITPGQQNAVYSVFNQTGFSYTWSITGGTIVSGQNTNAVTVDWDPANAFARTTAAGYSISVIETNTSGQTKKIKLNLNTLTTGTTQSLAQSGINVFPNPTNGSFNITMPESGVDVTYEILDLTGLSVANGTFTSTGAGHQIDANFDAGMYQVILKYNNVVTCARLSKVQ